MLRNEIEGTSVVQKWKGAESNGVELEKTRAKAEWKREVTEWMSGERETEK